MLCYDPAFPSDTLEAVVPSPNAPSRFRRPSGATLATARLPRRLDSEVFDEEEEVQEAIEASLLESEVGPTATSSASSFGPTASSSASSSSSKAASAGAVGAAYASNFSSGSASSRDTSAKKKIRVEKEPKA
jgi:hypothetical protein